MEDDIKFMKIALKEAQKAYNIGDTPIGAVIVKDGVVISKAHNEKELKQDVTKHAEILAIQKASKKIKNWRLSGCTIFVTLAPCNMCTGAIVQSRISKVVIGTAYKSTGAMESHLIGNCNFGDNINVKSGIMETECRNLLRDFFKQIRIIK